MHSEHNTNCAVTCQYIRSGDILCGIRLMSRHMTDDIEKARATRLANARREAGFETATDFVKHHAVVESTYLAHERGARFFKERTCIKYAELLGVAYEWLWSGNNKNNVIASVPIVGKVRGGKISPSHPLTGGFAMGKHKLMEAPFSAAPPESDPSLLFAIEVEDSHFAPFIMPGGRVYYNRTPDKTEDCIGALCVFKIKNGNAVCDILTRGSKPGLYDTQYHGKDLEIEWCAKKRFTKDA